MLPSDWEDAIHFIVQGEAVPKQSFRAGKHPHQTERVKTWETAVGWAAKMAMAGRSPLTGLVELRLVVSRTKKPGRRGDWDNTAKGCVDGMIGIVLKDDSQIRKATVILEEIKSNPMVEIAVRPMP